MTTTNAIKDLLEVTHDSENGLIFEKNVSIPRAGTFPIRCNVYRPIAEGEKFPVLVTYGPYGKDIAYSKYNKISHVPSRTMNNTLQISRILIQRSQSRAQVKIQCLGNP
jgi:hypothetical protein